MITVRAAHVWALIAALMMGTLVIPDSLDVGLSSLGAPPAQAQGAARPVGLGTVQRVTLTPVRHVAALAPAPRLSTSQREAMILRKLEIRERVALQSPPPARGEVGRLTAPVPETRLAPARLPHGNPADFVIGNNVQNPRANDPALGSTLAEPAAANNGRRILAAGNFDHLEYSLNTGTTWTNKPLPAGPPDAPNVCCDHDIVFDDARRVFFHSTLYVNSAVTNGIVRIFVYREVDAAAACFYDVDIADVVNPGTNILMDYPHLGLTNEFLYLSTNDIPAGTGPAQAARMWRLSIDEMVDCVTAPASFYTWPIDTEGQRVWVPAQGTNTRSSMYWAHQGPDTTQLRVFRWREADASPENVLRTVDASTFGNPDCRGGVNNTDFIGSTNAGPFGFQLRGAFGDGRLLFIWQVAGDASHTQGHMHAALFRIGPLPDAAPFNPVLIAQPHIFNNSFCFGFGHLAANKRGDFGLSIVAGGQAGGGGSAATPYVSLDDDYSPGGRDGFFGTIFGPTVMSTHNRSDGRFGDYFTTQVWEPCEKWFLTTSYGYVGGSALANVDSRYTEFGRNRDYKCWRNWRFRRPGPWDAP
ncbi:MAG: hypothetical protein QN187_07610 [Armatimonadota bacterium]|nr:hypothetical protein [Armatimonadota bacterium]MDR7519581.1 hypothetical protein [Armatimonadota bacterium]